MMIEDLQRFQRTFFPYSLERAATAFANGGRFAYYTSAETAFRILQNQEMWLRNAQLMNDFSEISHGLACVTAAYHGPQGNRLIQALEAWFPGLPREIEDLINNRVTQIQFDTYLTCLSEHRPEEDTRGRLSMWRAYGGSSGVAIVINGAIMRTATDGIGAYSSPVYYGTPQEFEQQFRRVVDGILAEEQFVRELDRDVVREAVFRILRYATVCTKHPGFREELEWRVVASPTLYQPPRLLDSLEVVRGVPQRVLKIKLEDAPDEGISGLALPSLIDRIIIGPSHFPQITALALGECLSKAGVSDAFTRIAVSDIPLRHIA